jgi:hypothetical protein
MTETAEYQFKTISDSFRLPIASTALTSSVIESLSDRFHVDPASIRLFVGAFLIPGNCVFSSRAKVDRPILVSLPSDPEQEAVLDDSEEESEDYIPEAVEEYIAELANIFGGEWTRDDCLRALRVVHFSPDSAAELLLSGEIPNHPSLATAKLNGMDPDPEVVHNMELIQLWADTKIDIPLLVQYYEACGRDYQKTYTCLNS